VNPHALAAKWRSKADIYRYLTQKKQFLLPSYRQTFLHKYSIFFKPDFSFSQDGTQRRQEAAQAG
jgi:predicted component of viral defense system (DUF524 family)